MVRSTILLLCITWMAIVSGYRHCGVRTRSTTALQRLPLHQSPLVDAASLDRKESVTTNYLLLLVGLPLASLLLPVLLEKITDGGTTAVERQYSIIELLLLKRLYIYSTGITTIDLISKISYNDRALDSGGFAQRLLRLNNDIFGTNVTVDFSAPLPNEIAAVGTLPNESREGGRGVGDPIPDTGVEDAYRMIGSQVQGGTEAALIPAIVAAGLLLSFGGVLLSRGAGGVIVGGAAVAVTLLSNLAVCFLFSKVQIKTAIRSIGFLRGVEYSTAAAAAAAALSVVCIASAPGSPLFPLFNVVNAFIAATVARLFLVEELRYIVFALLAMVAYDYFFVIGSAAFFTDNGQSIMEAVANAKSGVINAINSAPVAQTEGSDFVRTAAAYLQSCWRPGLLEVAIDGKVTDVLGLADMIFPAMLSSYCLRTGSARSYASSIIGVVVGCIICEVLQTGSGQPALLYIIPSMLAAVALEKAYSKLL